MYTHYFHVIQNNLISYWVVLCTNCYKACVVTQPTYAQTVTVTSQVTQPTEITPQRLRTTPINTNTSPFSPITGTYYALFPD